MTKETTGKSGFFDIPADWEKHWKGMPEFAHKNTKPVQKIVVNFATKEDVAAFGDIIGQKLSSATDTIWFPKKPKPYSQNKSYDDES